VALPFTLKKYLKAKEELWKLKYFTMQKKKPNLPKNPSKRNQNPSRYYNSITNLNQIFHHAKKKPNLPKNPSKRNQNPSRYYYNSITNLNQIFHHAKKKPNLPKNPS
jgi:hypothetical protein